MNIFNKDIIKEIETMKNSKKKQFFFGFNKSFNESSTFENISNIFPYPIKLIKVNDLKISKKSANIDKNDSILNNSINSIVFLFLFHYNNVSLLRWGLIIHISYKILLFLFLSAQPLH